MRFLPGGPALPDDLLTARDEGQVIFFCGAGISRAKANLPDFYGLADLVVEELRAAPHSPARRLIAAAKSQERIAGVGGLLPADRVFAILEREFLVADVRAAVARALCPTAAVDLSAHRTVLDLARDPSGATRLVTTNFDLLFEACDPALKRRSPPHLPDPRRPRDFNGVIHLHGRVTDTYDGAYDDEFVLSSADFGRAYLAEGWATQFIRALLGRYKLVFLGYAADDPPVQYLLEALSRADGPSGGLYGGNHLGFPGLRISRSPRPSLKGLPECDMPIRPVVGDGLDPSVTPEGFGVGAVSRLKGANQWTSLSSRPCLPLCWRRCKWQGPFAPRTLLRFIASTDPSATLSSSADFPVSPVIRPTLLRRFRAGTRRASPVA
jgi:SIR2-like domain